MFSVMEILLRYTVYDTRLCNVDLKTLSVTSYLLASNSNVYWKYCHVFKDTFKEVGVMNK